MFCVCYTDVRIARCYVSVPEYHPTIASQNIITAYHRNILKILRGFVGPRCLQCVQAASWQPLGSLLAWSDGPRIGPSTASTHSIVSLTCSRYRSRSKSSTLISVILIYLNLRTRHCSFVLGIEMRTDQDARAATRTEARKIS